MKESKDYIELVNYLKKLEKVAIAFSGGVDSTFLAYVAKEALGDNAVAITINSPYIPKWEIEEARELASFIGIKHVVLDATIPDTITNNPSDRCYLCKKVLFNMILNKAEELGYSIVADGSNFDDTKDYRPGMRALKEMKVASPLLECNWTKNRIREVSKSVNLSTHDKPAYACLLTRLPFNTEIDTEELERIEKSEVFMMSLGFKAIRVRSHGDLARIEVSRDKRKDLFSEDLLDKISDEIKSYGYRYVAIEASGYSMGSFNKQINK